MSAEEIKICVIGLGYVGLPLARLFATKYNTMGYDLNQKRVDALMSGHDSLHEVPDDLLQEAVDKYGLICTTDEEKVRSCNFYIVAVPTPVDENNHPDLTPLSMASEMVGRVICRGDYVVYESTVYPGMTEGVCLPIVERVSGLRLNEDFYAGYSPERINPGDREHTVDQIKKVTSGSTPKAASVIDSVYRSVVQAGTHCAPSIRVAEAAKIIENTQRDINIAFMNELAKIFNAMDIDTNDVLDAAASKWNFIRMKPGLVGGHCISVDPYYLIQEAQVYGVLPRIMTNARHLNDGMGEYVVNQLIRLMNKRGIVVKDAHILLLGFTFKENCSDIRNTKVADVYHTLSDYTNHVTICDTHVNSEDVAGEYGIQVCTSGLETMRGCFDAVMLCVAHDEFLTLDVRSFLKDPDKGVVYDTKSVLPRDRVDGRL
ncbi:MAG: nucleotide sugar dehydrogenase [Paludibacteraceae bacterium]|nr:nucleotide sugar dehydrogenase [Paludibacteraceae bacterium]